MTARRRKELDTATANNAPYATMSRWTTIHENHYTNLDVTLK